MVSEDEFRAARAELKRRAAEAEIERINHGLAKLFCKWDIVYPDDFLRWEEDEYG